MQVIPGPATPETGGGAGTWLGGAEGRYAPWGKPMKKPGPARGGGAVGHMRTCGGRWRRGHRESAAKSGAGLGWGGVRQVSDRLRGAGPSWES